MSLPEITDVQRLHLEPGDALVVNVGAGHLTLEDAAEVKAVLTERVSAALGREVPVLIVSAGYSLDVLSGGDMSAGAPVACEGRAPAGAPVPGSPVNPARETT